MPAPQPRMHGLTHVPGGSDPIPGVQVGAAGFAAGIADLATTRELLGYWRLGETSGVFADSSGKADPADGTLTAATTALTRATAGAPVDDDGAVRFNATDGAGSEYIMTDSTRGNEFNLHSDSTIVAFLKPGVSASSFVGNVTGQMTSIGGWRLAVTWPLRTILFQRAKEPSASPSFSLVGPTLPADTWTFVAATYSHTDGFKLYHNGVLVASDATLIGPALAYNNQNPYIGRGGLTGTASFYGAVDELSVWNNTLTAAEITALLAAAAPVAGIDYTTPTQLSGKVDRDAVETATARLVAVKLAAADTQPAFKIRGDGRMDWGQGGTAAADTSLYRKSGANLETAGSFWSGPGGVLVTGAGTVYYGAGLDASIRRDSAGTVSTDILSASRLAARTGADLTVAGNAVTVAGGVHRIVSNPGAATLTTINGGFDGAIVVLVNRTGTPFSITAAGNLLVPGGSATFAHDQAKLFTVSNLDGRWVVVG